MRHLKLEALARLVDEAPDPQEAAHLKVCAPCRDELEALRLQTEVLATLPKMVPTRDAWPELSQRLRAEGLIEGRHPTARHRFSSPGLIRLAAALALFIAGGATGYLARGPVAADPATAVASARQGPTSDSDGAARGDALRSGGVGGEDGAPETLSAEVERTEEQFAAALDRFMRASGTEASDPAARLAALDNIVLTTAEALNESPADPVINSYYLTAVAQRDQLLRQLSASSGEPVF